MRKNTFRDLLRQTRELTDILSAVAKEQEITPLKDIMTSVKWGLWAADSILENITEEEEA